MTEQGKADRVDRIASPGLTPVELPILAVAVVDPRAKRRERLTMTLEAGGLHVVGTFDDYGALGELDRTTQAAVLVEDSELAEDIIRPAEALKASRPDICLVAVTSVLTNRSVRDLFEVGIDAVVLEEDAEAALALSLRATYVGQVSVPVAWRHQFGRPKFSARQKQVLAMVVMGCTNATIARTLGVAESTVKSHLFAAFKKLGVRSRKEAAAAILDPRNGLGSGILTIPDGGGEPA